MQRDSVCEDNNWIVANFANVFLSQIYTNVPPHVFNVFLFMSEPFITSMVIQPTIFNRNALFNFALLSDVGIDWQFGCVGDVNKTSD